MNDEHNLYRYAAEYHLNLAEDVLKYAKHRADEADRHLEIAKELIWKRLEMEKD